MASLQNFPNIKIYWVGGVVRDHLLGKPAKDKDYVVVGATVEQMLAAGFEKVGAEFPVFLHPITREEYGLARSSWTLKLLAPPNHLP